MKRLLIMTVGKTHSGKSTFARELESKLDNSIVIDQDDHATFINKTYRALVPVEGPNTFKFAISNAIVEYAVKQTKLHLILCNSNRNAKGRTEMLNYFHSMGFDSILVHIDLPDYILKERVAKSQRSKAVFRSAASFEEVLDRQISQSHRGEIADPKEDEAMHLFTIRNSEEAKLVIERIATMRNMGTHK